MASRLPAGLGLTRPVPADPVPSDPVPSAPDRLPGATDLLHLLDRRVKGDRPVHGVRRARAWSTASGPAVTRAARHGLRRIGSVGDVPVRPCTPLPARGRPVCLRVAPHARER
ncbi:hypothetical protein GCM10009663_35820 [Kitasatospora arboriphila]|uniref:Uncharacterized protein n=1 Tax=Kitasatospora arboriphila TaxID=258052 RepID=A0ABP4E3A1_9ACTN